jgi:hypothetical protein
VVARSGEGPSRAQSRRSGASSAGRAAATSSAPAGGVRRGQVGSGPTPPLRRRARRGGSARVVARRAPSRAPGRAAAPRSVLEGAGAGGRGRRGSAGGLALGGIDAVARRARDRARRGARRGNGGRRTSAGGFSDTSAHLRRGHFWRAAPLQKYFSRKVARRSPPPQRTPQQGLAALAPAPPQWSVSRSSAGRQGEPQRRSCACPLHQRPRRAAGRRPPAPRGPNAPRSA